MFIEEWFQGAFMVFLKVRGNKLHEENFRNVELKMHHITLNTIYELHYFFFLGTHAFKLGPIYF